MAMMKMMMMTMMKMTMILMMMIAFELGFLIMLFNPLFSLTVEARQDSKRRKSCENYEENNKMSQKFVRYWWDIGGILKEYSS